MAYIWDGIVRVGTVNMDEERDSGDPYVIQEYLIIKYFGKSKKPNSLWIWRENIWQIRRILC